MRRPTTRHAAHTRNMANAGPPLRLPGHNTTRVRIHNATRSKSHNATRTRNSTHHHPRVLLVTTVTASYEHWLRHLHRNLLLFGLGRSLRVCAADNATAALSASLHIETISPASLGMHQHHAKVQGGLASASSPVSASDFGLSLRSQPSGKHPGVGETFMSSSWRAAVHFKQHCVWNLLERSAPEAAILLLDGDVTLFRDPLPVLLSLTSGGASLHGRRLDQGTWTAGGLIQQALDQFRSTVSSSSKPTPRSSSKASARSSSKASSLRAAPRAAHAAAAFAPAYDLAVMDDTTPTNDKRYLNSGFMLLRNTPATRAFGRAYLAQLQRRRTESENMTGVQRRARPDER